MNRKSLLLAVMLTLASLAWAQSAPPQTPPPKPPTGEPGHRDQMGNEHRRKMMEMDKQHMEAMKADVDKMKASLDQLKANVDKISEPAEKARWQTNVDYVGCDGWPHGTDVEAHGGHGSRKGHDAPRRNGRRPSSLANRTETGVSSRSGGVGIL
jgi:hypothetical protein